MQVENALAKPLQAIFSDTNYCQKKHQNRQNLSKSYLNIDKKSVKVSQTRLVGPKRLQEHLGHLKTDLGSPPPTTCKALWGHVVPGNTNRPRFLIDFGRVLGGHVGLQDA